MARQMALIRIGMTSPDASRFQVKIRDQLARSQVFSTAKQDTAGSQDCYTNVPIVANPPSEFNARSEVKAPGFVNGDGGDTNMLTILVVILLLVALGALPTWPYSRGWGYYPSGGLGLVVLVLVILLLLGRI
jgi:hypothetical protein